MAQIVEKNLGMDLISKRISRHSPLLWIIITGLALLPRILLLFSQSLPPGLGYDELQSVTHAYLPIQELLRSVKLFDPHPPLYYLQLHIWLLFGTSDLWVKLNSMMWGLLIIFSLFITSQRIYSRQVAVLATLFFCLSPYAVTYATEVRMYSFIMFLGIWCWFLTDRFLQGSQHWLVPTSLAVVTGAFLYSFGGGFLILISTSSYALILLLQNPGYWSRFQKWVIVQVILVTLYIPWLIQASSTHLAHLLQPNLTDIAGTFTVLLFGFRIPQLIWIVWPAGLMVVLIISILAVDTPTYLPLSGFLLFPLIACILISYFIRPIWLPRTLSHLSPFFSLGVALIVSKIFSTSARISNIKRLIYYLLLFSFSLGLMVGLGYELTNYSRWWAFKEASQFVHKYEQKSDIIYIPHERVFWGWSWYYVGPGSVNPLTTNYMLITDHNIKIMAKPALNGQLKTEQAYWIVYRDIDNVDFEGLALYLPYFTRTLQTQFERVTIEKLYLTTPQ